MDAHRFQDNDKVQRFCLTLTGEVRLWHESLRLINVGWIELQNSFRQQYLKIGNTREQISHTWRSFHFDKNMETIDAYVHCIRQVTTLLCYEETQILEVFKNTLPTRLLDSFPNSRLMTGSRDSKENLNKGKIDRQLAGQSSSTPFMNI